MAESLPIIFADLDIPNVLAFTTLRGFSSEFGASQAAYSRWNLGAHVGDSPEAVASNRKQLQAVLGSLSSSPASTTAEDAIGANAVNDFAPAIIGSRERMHAPFWLNQVHGTRVVEAVEANTYEDTPTADGAWTATPNVPCVVMTADCLPLVFAAQDGSEIAVIHAGWRGLCDGILAAAVAALPSPSQQLKVWMGPAIGPKAFEVGEDVRHAFISRMGQPAAQHFLDKNSAKPSGSDGGASVGAKKYFADLYGLARLQLRTLGVDQISGGGHCTYSEEDRFFSYRRNGVTGRMATVAMIRPAH